MVSKIQRYNYVALTLEIPHLIVWTWYKWYGIVCIFKTSNREFYKPVILKLYIKVEITSFKHNFYVSLKPVNYYNSVHINIMFTISKDINVWFGKL